MPAGTAAKLYDEMILEVLLAQAKQFPERRELLERWLDRAEPRAKMLHDEITTKGARLLASLDGSLSPGEATAAE